MKKTLLLVVALFSLATFAQKDEIKVLKRLDRSSGQPTQNDLKKMSAALTALDSKVDILSDDDKVLYHYFKVKEPIMDIMLTAMKTPNDLAAIQKATQKYNTPEFLESLSGHYKTMVALEKKLGDDEYTKEIQPLMNQMTSQLSKAAFQLNENKKYKEASQAFYALYKFDTDKGSNLENAAILAVQAKDYVLAEKLYDELKSSDYLENGVIYYAVNKASNKEETFATREDRSKSISIGLHEKPRNEKVSDKKPEVYKMLGIIASSNGNFEKAKKALAEARALNPNDTEITNEESRLYLNEAIDMLQEDQKIVDEINANLDDDAKYNELREKRKKLFTKALPTIERAYKLNSESDNAKNLLKMAYQVLEQNEKADALD